MRFRAFFLVGTLFALFTHAAFAITPRWMRYPALSPDGKTIAFEYQGDIFTVPAAGGQAVALTRGDSYEFDPVWSPDGKSIAFASDRFGNFDVFLVPVSGGEPKRLTFHSANEVPSSFTPDGKSVLFTAHRMDSASNAQFPSGVLPELYSVSVDGGRPKQILTTPALNAQLDRAGKRLLYEDIKGYESAWRKHEQAAICRDIWLCDLAAGTHTRLSQFAGEDRNPVFTPDEQSAWYLSERSGSFNVWKQALSPDAAPVQVTHFATNPVRFLSASAAGDLCFGYDGEIYTLAANATEPQKVAIEIAAGSDEPERSVDTKSEGATEMDVSPNGKEIAMVIRGDIFVASVDYGVTKRITETPEQERSVSFSPDGRTLLYAGERHGSWNLYETSLVKKDEPYFFAASELQEKEILSNGQENFQPKFRPDGKEIAYLENRVTLKVLDPATGKTRTALPAKWNYSYTDGDQSFDWSPDGKWLLVQYLSAKRWSTDAGLVKADGSSTEPVNLTKNGYEDFSPRWAMAGKMMFWFSNRDGLAGHGWDDADQSDVYALSFTQAAYDRFNLSKADFALAKEAEDKAKKDDAKKKAGDKKQTKADAGDSDGGDDEDSDELKPKLAKPLELDLQNLEDRTQRLTPFSSDLADAELTPDGETLLYLSRVDGGYDLWSYNRREDEKKVLAKLPPGKDDDDEDSGRRPSLMLDRKGENAYVLDSGNITQIELKTGKSEPVKFAAEVIVHPQAERAYFFEHVWRQMKEKLYVANMQGVNWDAYKKIYAKFLPFINNNRDFAEMLSEMLGELNVSHTGSGYYFDDPNGDKTGALGVFFDESYTGPGFKIAEVIEGGPLTRAKSTMKAGDIVEKINGNAIATGAEFDSLLNRTGDQPTLISAYDPATKKRWDETLKPISLGSQEGLLYQRWMRQRRALVEKLSGGRIGYVHIPGMADAEYRKVFGDAFGRSTDKEALIVDTRFNGGGDLTEDLIAFLSGTKLFENDPRGQDLGPIPLNRWIKPSAVVMSESNYSDADLFPTAYREMKLGPLVGMPVAGTGTAVWWETLQDETLYFGIPEVGIRGTDGNFLENHELEPDVKVPNDYESVAKGEDKQLEATVQTLLKNLGKK
jgi:Tol biopolymer transport system component/C-terminal processing protease CtpA/Prc